MGSRRPGRNISKTSPPSQVRRATIAWGFRVSQPAIDSKYALAPDFVLITTHITRNLYLIPSALAPGAAARDDFHTDGLAKLILQQFIG